MSRNDEDEKAISLHLIHSIHVLVVKKYCSDIKGRGVVPDDDDAFFGIILCYLYLA